MSDKSDPVEAFCLALQRGVQESVELEEGGALQLKQMEQDVHDNISVMGEIIKAELERRQSDPTPEILKETSAIIQQETPVTVNQVEDRLLELGSILHTALTRTKNIQPVSEIVEEPNTPVERPVEKPAFDEDKAKADIQNSFAKIASLLKEGLQETKPDKSINQVSSQQPEPEVSSDSLPEIVIEPDAKSKNDIINSYVNIIDQLDKAKAAAPIPTTEAEEEFVINQKILRYINEQVTALRVQIGHTMESGGGTVAQQFANGGTMNGNLTVTGTISASNYAGIPLQDLSGYLPLSGGTLTGNVSSTSSLFITGSGTFSDLTVLNSISANTINATLLNVASANITVIDIKQYELSGFNVTGNVSIAGTVSATGVIYASGGNSDQWNTSYTLVQTNSASWNNPLSAYSFIANGSTSIYKLSSTAPFTNAAAYIVAMNGALQTPNTDFTITYSGTNYLNLNYTPRAGALITVQVLGNGVITNSSVVTVSASTYNLLYTYVNSNFNINVSTGNYMVDTTTAGITGTLPTTPTLGTVIGFMDPYYTWATYNFTLSAPVNIENQSQPVAMNIAGIALKAIYVGGSYGWRLTQ